MSRQKDEQKAADRRFAARTTTDKRTAENKARDNEAHDNSVIEDVLKAIAPLVATAAVKAVAARDKAAPLAEQAKDRSREAAEQAKDRLQPLAEQAKDKSKEAGEHAAGLLAPLAAAAAAKAGDAKLKAAPLAAVAAEKVAPSVDTARAKVQDDLVPMLLDLLHQAEEHPAVSEATNRGKATVAALRGELSVPETKKRNVPATVAKVAAAGALLAATAVAIRQFLGTKDDEWTAHQPSAAYVNRPDSEPGTADAKLDAAETETVAPREQFVATDAAAGTVDSTTTTNLGGFEPNPEAVMSAEGGIAGEAEGVAEDLNLLNEYGEGAYVGEEPPASYTIKGNERSMKYHTAESGGYERTIADVWFDSTEAAERAGFTQAQR